MHPKHIKFGHESPTIPEELIMEILSCLSVKSLVRFQLLCKSWNSLIVDTFHHRYATNPRLLSISCDVPFNVSSLPVKSLFETPLSTNHDETHLICTLESRHTVIGSCNGLVCLLGTRTDDLKEYSWVCFLNPTTRSMSPKSPEVTFMNHIGTNGTDNYGFGYDQVSDTYKVLLLPHYWKKINWPNIKVFSMGDTNWRDTGFRTPLLRINGCRVGVNLNGTLNWLASRKNPTSTWGWDSDTIFSFDLNRENYVELELSLPHISDEVGSPYLGVLGGCLCVSDINRKNQNFIIWQMKEFGVNKSWIKLLSISDENHQPHLLGLSSRFPSCVFDNGDVLMLQQRLLYNHRDNRLDLLKVPNNIIVHNAMIYTESLISPLR